MKKYTYTSILLSALLPLVSFAAPLGGVKSLIVSVKDIINTAVIPLMFGLAIVYFFWGVIQFISKAGEEKAREEGKQKMLWGIIALFVFVSITGILTFIGNTLNISPGGLIDNSGNSGGGTCVPDESNNWSC